MEESFEMNETDKEAIEAAYREKGPAGFASALQERIDRWKTVPLNVAVIGTTGVGKSSYINCARNLTADDPGSAAVDVTECTADMCSYPHPQNEKLIYWDVPGVGTPKFPRSAYLDTIEFKRYDFYLLLSKGRFTSDDLWLANEIKTAGKRFFYIRTNVETDVANHRKSHPKSTIGKTEEDILEMIRLDIVKKLDLGDHNSKIYLIDSYAPAKYDFAALQMELLESLPALKREAFLYSLSPMATLSKRVLQEKLDVLRSRLWKVAAMTAVVGLVPVPGLSILVDLAVVIHEAKFYLQQLGLDEASLKTTATAYSIDVQCLRDTVSALVPGIITKSLGTVLTTLFEEMGKDTAKYTAQSILRWIPFIGAVVATPIAVLMTYAVLKNLLGKMEMASNKIIDLCVEKIRMKALKEVRQDCEDMKKEKQL